MGWKWRVKERAKMGRGEKSWKTKYVNKNIGIVEWTILSQLNVLIQFEKNKIFMPGTVYSLTKLQTVF